MEPKEVKVVAPPPYFEITFSCSNRRFYDVKSRLYELAEFVGIEIEGGYITEKCDYEGDLETIVVYDEARSAEFRNAILNEYDNDCAYLDAVASGSGDDLDFHLTCT